ncbi:MAG: dienelactone hydrolase family protein [Acidimicrobiales bacterium]
MVAGSAYLVVPPGEGPHPGVLVLHSWWGLTTFFKEVCDRLSDLGYVALAPDLNMGEVAETPAAAEARLADADMSQIAQLVVASAGTLRKLPKTTDGPIGVLGFSMGASWAMWLATRAQDEVRATVAYYGSQAIDFEGITSPILGHFADHDSMVAEDDVTEMYAHLKLVGVDVDFYTYPGTSHWFAEEDRVPAFQQDAAAVAWDRTVAFLGEHLPPNQ